MATDKTVIPTDSPTVETPAGWQSHRIEFDSYTIIVMIPPPYELQQWFASAGRAALQAVTQSKDTKQDGN